MNAGRIGSLGLSTLLVPEVACIQVGLSYHFWNCCHRNYRSARSSKSIDIGGRVRIILKIQINTRVRAFFPRLRETIIETKISGCHRLPEKW
jgi:hypothetical protein